MKKYFKLCFEQLRANSPPWYDSHTYLINQIKTQVKTLLCIDIPITSSLKIVQKDDSNISNGGILK